VRSFLLIIAITSFGSNLFSQGYRTRIDSLTYIYRIGGKLDSIDLISGFNTATYPGAGWNTKSNVLNPYFLVKNKGGQLFWSNESFVNYIHTGLPHLGVAYMFGSNAQQYIHAEYQQVFRANVLLNLRYIKKTSNGILRNSGFNEENVQFALRKTGSVYSFNLRSAYEIAKVEQSGGVISDSLPDLYSLPFIPVLRSSSELQTKRSSIFSDHYFDFIGDSSLASGLCLESGVQVKNFRLNESDTLYGLYPIINYDSLQTADQHQWSSASLGTGVFLSNRAGSIKLIPTFNFWNFRNLERYRDTLELALTSRFNYFGKRMKVEGSAFYNFQGAQNEWNEEILFKYQFETITLNFSSEVQSKLPDYYQRYAIGNNVLPIDDSWEKQLRSHHTLRAIKQNRNLFCEVNASHTLLKKNYFFADSIWRNDILSNINFIQLGSTSGFNIKVLHGQLNYSYTRTSGIASIIPNHQLFSRIYLKGGIFKARKMISYSGIETGYLSSFTSIGYLPQVGALTLTPAGKTVSQQFLLHCYAGFQIDEFKFFFRLENIQSFWSPRSTQQVSGYPVAPFQIKLGVTWDFFD
jgi:hypothetical protein